MLIVDDGQNHADFLALRLQAHGAEVQCAYTQRDGLELMACWRPDVALVDIGIPDISGYDVAELIRAGSDGGQVLLVAVTGFSDPSVEEKAREAGFDDRLLKPLDFEKLSTLIARHIESRDG